MLLIKDELRDKIIDYRGTLNSCMWHAFIHSIAFRVHYLFVYLFLISFCFSRVYAHDIGVVGTMLNCL